MVQPRRYWFVCPNEREVGRLCQQAHQQSVRANASSFLLRLQIEWASKELAPKTEAKPSSQLVDSSYSFRRSRPMEGDSQRVA
jgi:hypothetical protein